MKLLIRIPFFVALISFIPESSAQISLAGAGYRLRATQVVAPGQVISFFFTGIKTRFAAPVEATTLPLPTTLGGISVTISQANTSYSAPLFRIQQTSTCADATNTSPDCFITAVTVQIPFELQEGVAASATIAENGSSSQSFSLAVTGDRIHVLTSCDTILGLAPTSSSDICPPIVTHADGSPVLVGSPAEPGETVVIYAVGLGSTYPAVKTGQPSPSPAPSPNTIRYYLTYDSNPNALASQAVPTPQIPQGPPFAWLTPGYVGLYQINAPIPQVKPGPPFCQGEGGISEGVFSTLTINVTGSTFDGAPICVGEPPVDSPAATHGQITKPRP